MIPRNTTSKRHFRLLTDGDFLALIACKSLHLTTIQIKDSSSYVQNLYKIQSDPLDLNKLMKNEKRLQRVLCRDAGRSPLANIDPDQYIYFVHTRALCRRFSTLLQRFGHVTTKQVYTSVR